METGNLYAVWPVGRNNFPQNFNTFLLFSWQSYRNTTMKVPKILDIVSRKILYKETI
jgi:hypothetical protein